MKIKKKVALSGLLLCCAITAKAQVCITPQVEQRARELVSQMTLEEKIDYISGPKSFYIRAVPRLGIPEIRMADGPQGIRNNTQSTLYPCGILSASTWNRKLARELGHGLARDAKARGVSILLGPGVNIYRSPLCGRNYEYFGEDPYLTGETAKEYILGVQEEGVMATVKHFAANNQEWSRHHASSDVDERTLQEIYFPAFRKAVQEAPAGSGERICIVFGLEFYFYKHKRSKIAFKDIKLCGEAGRKRDYIPFLFDQTSIDLAKKMMIGFPVKRKVIFLTGHQSGRLVSEFVLFIITTDTYNRIGVQIPLLEKAAWVSFQLIRQLCNKIFSFYFHIIRSPFICGEIMIQQFTEKVNGDRI